MEEKYHDPDKYISYQNYQIIMDYAESIQSGQKLVNKETKQMVKRFYKDIENRDYLFKPKAAETVINLIEKQLTHDKGETFDGQPLRGKPFLLEPWQKFILYNLMSFYHVDSPNVRRFQEAFIFMPRKNGKTRFVAALSWALSLLNRLSMAETYIVGASLQQAKQTFEFLNYNIKHLGLDKDKSFRILDNNQETSISGDFGRVAGKDNGAFKIRALAANPDRQDSLGCNIAIADEIHAYRTAKQYNVIKEAMKAYTNKLMIGITTAGDNQNSFCYQRLKYCKQILDGTVENESYFVFIAKADEDENGYVDLLDPVQHEKANPNYGVTIRPRDFLEEAKLAFNSPVDRKDFMSKSLNIYTSATNAYFDIEEFRVSNRRSEEELELDGLPLKEKFKRLAKLPIKWYGGVDLSRLHDLTAVALYGRYEDIDIVIPHAFFPRESASQKSEDDNIPVFGWEDDGWLTMTSGNVTDHDEVVKWLLKMEEIGFKITRVGYDVKFADEFVVMMRNNGFGSRLHVAPQYAGIKAEGFRRIEARTKAGKFYYLSSDAYEYCVQNVQAVERTDALHYKKVFDNSRIDLFDASVFAVIQMMEVYAKNETAKTFYDGLRKTKGGR